MTTVAMCLAPDYDLLFFGAVSAISFFWPGYRAWRRKEANEAMRQVE